MTASGVALEARVRIASEKNSSVESCAVPTGARLAATATSMAGATATGRDETAIGPGGVDVGTEAGGNAPGCGGGSLPAGGADGGRDDEAHGANVGSIASTAPLGDRV